MTGEISLIRFVLLLRRPYVQPTVRYFLDCNMPDDFKN